MPSSPGKKAHAPSTKVPSARFGKFVTCPHEVFAAHTPYGEPYDPVLGDTVYDEDSMRTNADEQPANWVAAVSRRCQFYHPLLKYPTHGKMRGDRGQLIDWKRGYITNWNHDKGFGFLVVHEEDAESTGVDQLFCHASRYVEPCLELAKDKLERDIATLRYETPARNATGQVEVPSQLDRGTQVFFTLEISSRTGKPQAKDWTLAMDANERAVNILKGVDNQRRNLLLSPVLEVWVVSRVPVGQPKADNVTKTFVQDTKLVSRCLLKTNIVWLFTLFVEQAFAVGQFSDDHYPEFRLSAMADGDYGKVEASVATNFPLEIAAPIRNQLNGRLAFGLKDYATVHPDIEFVDHGDYKIEQVHIG